MSRAVLLPTPGDPFLLQYWLNLYKTIWAKEIDSLYVYVNSPIPADVLAFDYEILQEAGVKRIFHANEMIDHGRALEEMLAVVDEDLVMLIEDDGFIFKPDKVQVCFQKIENGYYQIVGSKRGSCSQEIIEMAEQKWQQDYTSGYGDQGCNFWPNFLFVKTDLLKSIGGHFGASAWQAGEMLEGLEMRCKEFCNGDTLVSASLRLREKVPEKSIWYENQFHGNTDDMPDYNNRMGIWSGQAAWTHAGSLSTGVTNLLDIHRPLPKNLATTDQEKLELERRVMYWQIFWENATPTGIEKFHTDYKLAIDRLIAEYDLSEGRINQRKVAYYQLLPRFNERAFNG